MAKRVMITRDEFGVPHVHGDTDAAAVFGGMYARAEDEMSRIESAYAGLIGRAALNHIAIDNPSVSAQHAILARVADSYRLKDLNSTNGTLVNGVSITDAELKDGDKIRFGSVVAVFCGMLPQRLMTSVLKS